MVMAAPRVVPVRVRWRGELGVARPVLLTLMLAVVSLLPKLDGEWFAGPLPAAVLTLRFAVVPSPGGFGTGAYGGFGSYGSGSYGGAGYGSYGAGTGFGGGGSSGGSAGARRAGGAGAGSRYWGYG